MEQGEHASLVAAGGTYQRLWEINEAALGEIALVERAEGVR